MNKRLDLTRPETLHRLAALPYYGQAITVLRGPFPEWGLDPDIEHEFTVKMERVCGCNCPNCFSDERKAETIEARTIAEAIALAERANPDWEIVDCRLAHCVNLDVPDWIYEGTA